MGQICISKLNSLTESLFILIKIVFLFYFFKAQNSKMFVTGLNPQKHCRNFKFSDVILALLREHLQSLLIGELPSNACPENLSYLIKRLWREFSLYDESSRGTFEIPYRQSICRVHPASPDSVYRLRMNDCEYGKLLSGRTVVLLA